jgi:hypothetical protein
MNPINRLAALLGLIVLTPIAYGVATGSLDMVDAAIRAGLTLGAVIVIRMIGRFGVSLLADSMERQAVVVETPQRRATDREGAAA